jgi:hypothetical protein
MPSGIVKAGLGNTDVADDPPTREIFAIPHSNLRASERNCERRAHPSAVDRAAVSVKARWNVNRDDRGAVETADRETESARSITATKPSPPLFPKPDATEMNRARGNSARMNPATLLPALNIRVWLGMRSRSMARRSAQIICATDTNIRKGTNVRLNINPSLVKFDHSTYVSEQPNLIDRV